MINRALFAREMKVSIKPLAIISAVIALYVTVIISMYDPETIASLDRFIENMPEIMAAVGMSSGADSLLGFMVSYLYGFILLLFPMIFSILRGNGLIAKYVDSGSMAVLAASPVRRRTIALTQALALVFGIFLLTAFTTLLEFAVARIYFPGELELTALLRLNTGMLCLHLCVGGICFLCSCVFSDTRRSIAF